MFSYPTQISNALMDNDVHEKSLKTYLLKCKPTHKYISLALMTLDFLQVNIKSNWIRISQLTYMTILTFENIYFL